MEKEGGKRKKGPFWEKLNVIVNDVNINNVDPYDLAGRDYRCRFQIPGHFKLPNFCTECIHFAGVLKL